MINGTYPVVTQLYLSHNRHGSLMLSVPSLAESVEYLLVFCMLGIEGLGKEAWYLLRKQHNSSDDES